MTFVHLDEVEVGPSRLERLGDVNILVGDNGTGKSTVFDWVKGVLCRVMLWTLPASKPVQQYAHRCYIGLGETRSEFYSLFRFQPACGVSRRALEMSFCSAQFVENIEYGFHPATLKRYVQLLVQRAHARRVQLFITTHSLECLDLLLRAAEEAGAKAVVYSFSRTREVTRIDAVSTRVLIESGTDPRYLDWYA